MEIVIAFIEGDYERQIRLHDDATNGDIRRVMFPDEKVIELEDIVIVMGKDKEYQHHYSKDFWNAPYKGGQE